MKHLFLGFVLLLLSIWLGLEVSRSAGYVLITYRYWSIETSLWVALVLLLFSFALFYLLLRILHRTISFSNQWKRWKKMRYYRKARRMTHNGMCELAEGRWQKAESTLLKSAKISANPLMNYLSAARAAQAQHAYERRDNYFRQAHNTSKGSSIAIDLTQAQLQVDSEQWEPALTTLKHLQQTSPRHPYGLTLLEKIYTQQENWKELKALLPNLKKDSTFSPTALENLETKLHCSLLSEASSQGLKPLREAWQTIPRRCQQHTGVVNHYAHALIDHQDNATAILLIENTIKKNWDPKLIQQYGLTSAENSAKQLTLAEHWLKKHPKEPELLLCLGRLSIREKFWGKAKEYLETSIHLQPTVEAYTELGNVFSELNEQEAALEAYRKGLDLS